MNLMTLLEMAAESMAGRTALQCGAARFTCAELFAGAGRAAQRIRAAQVSQVALLDVASPALPLALFGAAWAGVPFTPLNYRLSGAELDALLERISPALLVTDSERAARLAQRPGLQVLAREDFIAHSTPGEADAAGEADAPPGDWSMQPEDPAVLLFTSGTTGAPKAAVLRHRHLVSYILSSVEFMGAAEEEANLVSVPPYHVAGVAALLSSLYAGRRIVQLAEFSPGAWLDCAESESISHAFLVPTMLARIADELAATGRVVPPTLRALAYGGGRMPLPVIERAMRLFPPTASFTNAYGLTETSSTLAVLGPEEHRAALAGGDAMARQRLASVGRPLPGIEVQVRGPGGELLPPGQRGEIHVRGEQVSGEYLGGHSRLQADGWFPTRDGGYLDSAGYLFVEGRMDDIIVRGGENLSPGEIEAVLHEHESVADCAVVGVPDEEWGEAVAAVVALEAGRSASARELQTHVRARLRGSRVPTSVHFVDQLPYSETGKLLRREIRDFLAAPPEPQPEPASQAPAAEDAAPADAAQAEAPEAAAPAPAPRRAKRRRVLPLLGMALLAAALLAAWFAFSRI